MNFVLYLNLWNATSKLLGSDAVAGEPAESRSPLFRPDTLADCHSHFRHSLAAAARGFEIRSYAFIDSAYAVSPDLDRLIAFSVDILRAMAFPNERPLLWPVRGAISAGATPDPEALIPWSGSGPVKAAELEKSAQKGMRLLLDGRLPVSGVPVPFRAISVRGHDHFELNWLETPVNPRFSTLSTNLMDLGTNYSQQLAASINDLTRWAQQR